MLENHQASEKETFDKFCDEVMQDQSYWGAIITYWFANNYRSFYVDEVASNALVFRKHERSVQRVDSARRSRAVIDEAKQALKVALLDLTLSTGKALRHSSFGDCRREGGWLLDVSKCGRANEIVGKKLSEADLRNILQRQAA